jgi:hypothetical protein
MALRKVNRKRSGDGGNAAKDPRNNLVAQKNFQKKFGKDKKRCTGFLHHDGPEIPIVNFIQQKTNSATGLQSRCALCNRLYFSIIQKPIKRIAGIAIWAEQSGEYDWRSEAPKTLVSGIEQCLRHWLDTDCGVANCRYTHPHSSYRSASKTLTKAWTDLDKGLRDGSIIDKQTSRTYPAPIFMQDLQNWAGPGGALSKNVETSMVWDWWCDFFDKDTATDSSERRAVEEGKIKGPPPEHPLTDFFWGSGNILETTQGHSVPGFNQVKSGSKMFARPSSNSRVYGYLVEGNRLAMMKFSKECKVKGLSLGHSPAPLRWLGKDDPINGRGQPLEENIQLSDSLSDLYDLAKKDINKAIACVSWQIVDPVKELIEQRVGFEEFTQKIQAVVEKYLDDLLLDINEGEGLKLKMDLMRADPGKTETVYTYRERKVSHWLSERPTAKRNANSLKKG